MLYQLSYAPKRAAERRATRPIHAVLAESSLSRAGLVETTGIEPATSCLQSRRSTN